MRLVATATAAHASTPRPMTRSELTNRLTDALQVLPTEDVAHAVKTLLEQMTEELAAGGRIEIRGFGAFSVRRRPARITRNPKTGEKVAAPEKCFPYFKPGKEMRDRVALAFQVERAAG